jgi:hypothetical protein
MQLAVACPGATWRLTAIYLCNPCSCQEILEVARHGPLGRHERGVEADLVVVYRMPLAEVIGTHFHDKIKAASSGFASFDYAEAGYEKARAAPSLLAPRSSPLAPRPTEGDCGLPHTPTSPPRPLCTPPARLQAPISKLQLVLNGEPVDALSVLVHKQQAMQVGKRLVRKLKDTIPRQLFDIAIQAKSQGESAWWHLRLAVPHWSTLCPVLKFQQQLGALQTRSPYALQARCWHGRPSRPCARM